MPCGQFPTVSSSCVESFNGDALSFAPPENRRPHSFTCRAGPGVAIEGVSSSDLPHGPVDCCTFHAKAVATLGAHKMLPGPPAGALIRSMVQGVPRPGNRNAVVGGQTHPPRSLFFDSLRDQRRVRGLGPCPMSEEVRYDPGKMQHNRVPAPLRSPCPAEIGPAG